MKEGTPDIPTDKVKNQEELIIHLRKKNAASEEKINELREQLNNANKRINDLLEKLKDLQDKVGKGYQIEKEIPYFQINLPE